MPKSAQVSLPSPDSLQAGSAPLMKTKNAKEVLSFIHSVADLEIQTTGKQSELRYSKNNTILLLNLKDLLEEMGYQEIYLDVCINDEVVSRKFLVGR